MPLPLERRFLLGFMCGSSNHLLVRVGMHRIFDVVQEGDDLLNEVETFNPFPLLSLTVLKGHRMHLKGDLVDPRKLVKDCHEAIEESLHSIAILLSNLFH